MPQDAQQYVNQHQEKQRTGAAITPEEERNYIEALTLIAGVRMIGNSDNEPGSRLLQILSDGYINAVYDGPSGIEWNYTVGDKVFRQKQG